MKYMSNRVMMISVPPTTVLSCNQGMEVARHIHDSTPAVMLNDAWNPQGLTMNISVP